MRISHNGPFKMFYMRFAHRFETMLLDQFDDPAETRAHVGRQNLELISNAGVEQFYNPRHSACSIAFLQCS